MFVFEWLAGFFAAFYSKKISFPHKSFDASNKTKSIAQFSVWSPVALEFTNKLSKPSIDYTYTHVSIYYTAQS